MSAEPERERRRPRAPRPRRRLPRPRPRPPGAARRQLARRARRVLRARRRVGLRQVDRRARDRPLPAAQRSCPQRDRSRSTAATCSRSGERSCASSARMRCRWSTRTPARRLNPSIRVGRAGRRGLHRPRRDPRARRANALARGARTRADRRPRLVMGRYPHQLSGGMQQRVVIAMALAKDPALLILDEPTTGLDATVEAEVLDLVAQLQAEFHTSVLFISHNLGVIAKMCSRVGVLYAGRLVEEGPVETVLQDPRHPYTVGLLRCIPRGGVRKDHGRLDTIPGFLPSLGAELAGCVFADRCALADERCRTEEPPLIARRRRAREPLLVPRAGARRFRARKLADIELPRVDRDGAPARASSTTSARSSSSGDTRSTPSSERRARDLARRDARARRRVRQREDDARTDAARNRRSRRPARSSSTAARWPPTLPEAHRASDLRALQIVFQNPDSALNRRHSVRRILLRSLKKLAGVVRRRGRAAACATSRVASALTERTLTQKPVQLSGGLKQRVAIARAFAGDPEARRLRRADLRARRLRAGGDPQPARRAPGGEAGLVPLHLARPRGRPLHLRSDRRPLPRPAAGARPGRGRLRRARTTRTPRRCCPRCRRSTAAGATGSGSRATSRAPPSRPRAASSTRAARACSARSAIEQEPPLVEVEDGHLMRCHIPIEELRELQGEGARSTP